MIRFVPLNPARARTISAEIIHNSHPGWRFYALLITASMIACFGLAANSTAVIIGAMLVSPLMTPIFGIALGMLRGDVGLIGRASRAEIGGVILAIASACLIGLSPLFSGEATPEMLSRTQPNLIDLLVAIFAGFAGAFALVDDRLSPALPGVAIATAIVPPLSTCGLCLALKAWEPAGGALMLFLANFVSILVVSLITFGVSGLTQSPEVTRIGSSLRRFAPTAIAFVLVTFVMTRSLIEIIKAQRIERDIRTTLVTELSSSFAVELDGFTHNVSKERVEVLANVRAPRVIMPRFVTELQQKISDRIKIPVDLVVRTTLARDVSAFGSQLRVGQPDIHGAFLTRVSEGAGAKELLAAQVVREFFEGSSGFEMTNIEYGIGHRGDSFILAHIDSLTTPTPDDIHQLERMLQHRLEEPRLTLALRRSPARIDSSHGPFLTEWTDWSKATPADYLNLSAYEETIRQTVSGMIDAIPLDVHFRFADEALHVLTEVAGPTPVNSDDVKRVEAAIHEALSRPVQLSFWYRNEFIVNADRYTTYQAIARPGLAEQNRALQAIFGSNTDKPAARPRTSGDGFKVLQNDR